MASAFCKRAFVVLLLLSSSFVVASTLSGTIKDRTGAVVVHARVEITGAGLAQPIVVTSDNAGQFTTPDLDSGHYSLKVAAPGFEDLERPVDLPASSLQVELVLSLPIAKEEVTVRGKYAQFANSDQVYRGLRDVGL